MEKRQLTMIALACAGVAVVCVFLPWLTAGEGDFSISASGTEGELKGVWVLILSILGGAAVGLVVAGKVDVVPLEEQPLLFIAVLLFGLAALLTLTDFLRDFGHASRGIGLILAQLATIGATVATVFAALKAKAAPKAD